MRMRKLGHGQSVLFVAPQEVDRKIREAAGKTSSDDVVSSLDVLRWAMQETCADIQHHVPHWAQQGVDFLRRNTDWALFSSSEDGDASTLKHSWLQPESRRLESLYGPKPCSGLRSAVSQYPELQSRCQKLGVSSLPETQMEEEQEREVLHEIEREREVERPPKAKPATHQVHYRVREFVRTGMIVGQSAGDLTPFSPIHLAATEPSAWSSDLLVTCDFMTTIHAASPSDGDYLRTVHWIVSSASSGKTVLVVLSPYEVNELLPEIRQSKSVHLHQYTPRVTQAMKPLDDLRFYCIPTLPESWAAPPASLTQELNLFAGQLYLPDYEAYQHLSVFLGLYNKLQVTEDVIESDGFVKPEHRRGTTVTLRGFQKSPLPALKKLIGYRRKGMSYYLTHLGKILHARILTEKDFDFAGTEVVV
jgi:hypothetical protein